MTERANGGCGHCRYFQSLQLANCYLTVDAPAVHSKGKAGGTLCVATSLAVEPNRRVHKLGYYCNDNFHMLLRSCMCLTATRGWGRSGKAHRQANTSN